jgi:nucleoside-diphosphate-sugar epimerase
MRVFVAGASGALGSRLVPQLIDAGHEVIGTHHSPASAELLRALGAKPPRRFPTWLARLIAGEAAVVMGTEARGASNAKAKRELGWTPRYPSWRKGFPAAYSGLTVADGPKPHSAPRTSHSPR